MKKLLVFLCFLVAVCNVQAGGKNPSNCTMQDVTCIQHQFVDAGEYGVWSPTKGAILFYGGNNLFQAHLYFDQQAIDFYKNNSWSAFEIDINFPDNNNYMLPRIESGSVKGPSGTKPLRDTIIGDFSTGTRSITVTNPSAMKVGWNTFAFELKDNIFVSLGNDVKITAYAGMTVNGVLRKVN